MKYKEKLRSSLKRAIQKTNIFNKSPETLRAFLFILPEFIFSDAFNPTGFSPEWKKALFRF